MRTLRPFAVGAGAGQIDIGGVGSCWHDRLLSRDTALEKTERLFRRDVVAQIAAQQKYFKGRLTRYRIARIVVIVPAGLVPVLTTMNAIPRYVLGILGAIAAITEALIQLYRWRDSALAAQRTANSMESQLNLYRTGAGPYNEELELAFHRFATAIENIRDGASESFAGIWVEDTPPSRKPPKKGPTVDRHLGRRNRVCRRNRNRGPAPQSQ
jgi:hypothetical protein